MNKKHRVLAVIMLVVFACSMAASAAPNVNVARADGAIAGVGFTFDLNQSTGLVRYDASVTAVTSASNVYVATVIQRLSNGSWVNVPGTFLSKSVNGQYALVGDSTYVTKGYWYRTQNTFIATQNGVQTKKVENSDSTWYN